MKIITGGLGFIGSNIVNHLHSKNPDESLIIVDRISSRQKFLNSKSIRSIKLIDPKDKNQLFKLINKSSKECVIYHMGACSSTTEKNGDYL